MMGWYNESWIWYSFPILQESGLNCWSDNTVFRSIFISIPGRPCPENNMPVLSSNSTNSDCVRFVIFAGWKRRCVCSFPPDCRYSLTAGWLAMLRVAVAPAFKDWCKYGTQLFGKWAQPVTGYCKWCPFYTDIDAQLKATTTDSSRMPYQKRQPLLE